MTTNHTPGPWFCTKAKHGIDGSHYAIAVVGDDRGDRALVIHAAAGDDRQAESNAQLFLGAPELLAASETALGYIEAVCFNTPNPKKRKNYADCASILRAAIAKAKGEQQ